MKLQGHIEAFKNEALVKDDPWLIDSYENLDERRSALSTVRYAMLTAMEDVEVQAPNKHIRDAFFRVIPVEMVGSYVLEYETRFRPMYPRSDFRRHLARMFYSRWWITKVRNQTIELDGTRRNAHYAEDLRKHNSSINEDLSLRERWYWFRRQVKHHWFGR